MGFVNWLFGINEEPKERDTAPELTPPIVDDVLLQALLNSETITREKALTLPAVSGAVDFISNAVASMPVKLYKYKDGKVETIDRDPRVRMLNGDTGDTLDAFQMKKAMVSDYLLGKGGYCYIRRSRNDVTGLFYVEDRYIDILRVPEPIYKDFQILVMGKAYKPFEFIKLLRNTKDGASGVGLTVEISKELETAYQTLLYQLGMVKNGGNKKGFLRAERKLGQEEINALKKAWRNLYANNTENVVVLNNGLDFKEASNTSVEMQLNESKKTLQDEINNLFHISDDFEKTFKFAIYPIVKAFETALNRDLLLEKEKKNCFFEFDVKEIIRASLKDRYESYKLAKETGFMTLNEIRRAENMNWIEGLDVVNVGLGAVLYDTNKHVYYTPNTDTVGDLSDEGANESVEEMDKMLEGHELAEAYDESGNSAERDLAERFNENHGKDGRFTYGSGGGSDSSGGGSGSSGGGSGDASGGGKKYAEYTYSSDVDEGQPSVSYGANAVTYAQKEAVREYTAGDYERINEYLNGKRELSGDEKAEVDEIIKQIDSTMTGKTDSDMMVYRGIAIKASDIDVGDTIDNKGFTSTSANIDIANDFANYYGGSTIQIRVPKGTPALFVGYNTGGDFDEAEMLFGRGASIVIIEKNGNDIIGEIRYGN